MVWAGLRGAVGVAMSLFVLFDPLIESAEFKVRFALLCFGVLACLLVCLLCMGSRAFCRVC